jgi:hypothetical protein
MLCIERIATSQCTSEQNIKNAMVSVLERLGGIEILATSEPLENNEQSQGLP